MLTFLIFSIALECSTYDEESYILLRPEKSKNRSQNTVRIGAGQWRSRLLKFPDAEGLRPTPDRVRQTVFNWLGQDLTGKACLDLFAGTGVMGFEALSRNARSVTLVELAKAPYQALLQNKSTLKATDAQIVQNLMSFFVIRLINSSGWISCCHYWANTWLKVVCCMQKLNMQLNRTHNGMWLSMVKRVMCIIIC